MPRSKQINQQTDGLINVSTNDNPTFSKRISKFSIY